MHFFSFLVLFFQVTYIVVNSFSIPSSTILTNRKLKYERFKWEDQNLPFPNSIHEIVQVKSTSRHSSSSVSRPQFEHGRMTKSELTPLYPGYGTHFAYIYVGTPPQRQSVIIDTGSHYTAFPCTGCIQCGSHTDEYFDLKNSTTSKIQMCATDIPCPLSQSYSEGSMWKGFKVSDKLWVGGLSETLVQNAATFSTDFTFACQTTETGLFRTQLADGIMGMSIARDTIPSVLKDSGITDNSIFALCYRTGGGIMTLGGVDQRVHLPNQPLNYAKMSNVNGWYGLSLVDISLSERASTRLTKVPGVTDIMTNQGKHCIVDSGTTDTYFPVAIQKQFIETFSKITGINYSADTVTLTDAQVAKIPNIIFTFESYHETDNSTFSVMMPWTNYLDAVGGNKYTFRIYLSELNNVLLGANFMNGLNVIFDSDNNRVGFAKSNCRYEEFEMKATSVPTRSPHSYLSDDGTDDDNNVPTCTMVPTTPCNAQCDKVLINTGAIKEGIQKWEDSCGVKEVNGTGDRVCHVSCYGPKLARGDVDCHDTPWSECDKSCLQTRKVKKIIYQYGYKSVKKNRQLFQLFGSNSDYSTANINDHSISHSHSNAPYNNKNNLHSAADDKCAYTSTPRVCYTGACPVNDGDYVMFIDMKVKINPQEWSYVHSEAFYAAFANIFKVSYFYLIHISMPIDFYINTLKLYVHKDIYLCIP